MQSSLHYNLLFEITFNLGILEICILIAPNTMNDLAETEWRLDACFEEFVRELAQYNLFFCFDKHQRVFLCLSFCCTHQLIEYLKLDIQFYYKIHFSVEKKQRKYYKNVCSSDYLDRLKKL